MVGSRPRSHVHKKINRLLVYFTITNEDLKPPRLFENHVLCTHHEELQCKDRTSSRRPEQPRPWILTATSTTSAPAPAQASMAATPAPAVSCVCTWMGTSGKRSLRAPIRSLLLSGFSRPAMSWMWRWKETCQWRLVWLSLKVRYVVFGEDILNQERKIVIVWYLCAQTNSVFMTE